MKFPRIFPNTLVAASLFVPLALAVSCGTGPEKGQAVTDVFDDKVDTTVNPAMDFFLFANGKWFKNNPIPQSEVSWGIGNLVREEIYNNLRKISEDAAAENAAAGSDTRKIGDFWSAGMDSANSEKQAATPLQKEFEQIAAIKTPKEAVDVMIALEPLQAGIFYSGFYVGQDMRNSAVMSVYLSQGGLGLEERDYYFSEDPDNVKNRSEYVSHVSKMLQLLGDDMATADKMAAGIMAFETELAKNSRKMEDLRVPEANYNPMAIADVTKKLTPLIDWSKACTQVGISKIDTLVIGQPEFFSGMNKAIASADVDVLKAYMRFHLVSGYASYLSSSINREHFNFYGKILSGAKDQRPRWKRVLDSEEEAMGMVLGKLFVAEYFPEKTKARYTNLVEVIREAYAERIKKLDWMSDSTRQLALAKLARMNKKVGYPDKWKDYSTLQVGTGSWCANMMQARSWHFNDMISKYGKPVDREEWDMTPQTYNAYYNPSNNEIVLPAAIFVIPGSPDSLLDDAVVYGYAAASTIGHEITHGFDDEGRSFDANGNLVDWWTPQDADKFGVRSQLMVAQFDNYEPLPGKHINGKASLGENIADYGGVLLGLDAFKKTEQYKKGEKINGYTPTQRYFMGYALGWMVQQEEKELARRLMVDVHAPAKWRVNGPFSNIPEFYEAFNVKEGDPMWRADSLRVKIW
jgi:putative endopeptidase